MISWAGLAKNKIRDAVEAISITATPFFPFLAPIISYHCGTTSKKSDQLQCWPGRTLGTTASHMISVTMHTYYLTN
jgi:hypothetical protein